MAAPYRACADSGRRLRRCGGFATFVDAAATPPCQGERLSVNFLSNRRLEDLGINLAEEVGVKPLNSRRGVFFINDEAEIDVGRTMRNHEDVDVR